MQRLAALSLTCICYFVATADASYCSENNFFKKVTYYEQYLSDTDPCSGTQGVGDLQSGPQTRSQLLRDTLVLLSRRFDCTLAIIRGVPDAFPGMEAIVAVVARVTRDDLAGQVDTPETALALALRRLRIVAGEINDYGNDRIKYTVKLNPTFIRLRDDLQRNLQALQFDAERLPDGNTAAVDVLDLPDCDTRLPAVTPPFFNAKEAYLMIRWYLANTYINWIDCVRRVARALPRTAPGTVEILALQADTTAAFRDRSGLDIAGLRAAARSADMDAYRRLDRVFIKAQDRLKGAQHLVQLPGNGVLLRAVLRHPQLDAMRKTLRPLNDEMIHAYADWHYLIGIRSHQRAQAAFHPGPDTGLRALGLALGAGLLAWLIGAALPGLVAALGGGKK